MRSHLGLINLLNCDDNFKEAEYNEEICANLSFLNTIIISWTKIYIFIIKL